MYIYRLHTAGLYCNCVFHFIETAKLTVNLNEKVCPQETKFLQMELSMLVISEINENWNALYNNHRINASIFVTDLFSSFPFKQGINDTHTMIWIMGYWYTLYMTVF